MLEKLKKDENVLKIIKFSSMVYGTITQKSDKDYIVIVNDKYK